MGMNEKNDSNKVILGFSKLVIWPTSDFGINHPTWKIVTPFPNDSGDNSAQRRLLGTKDYAISQSELRF